MIIRNIIIFKRIFKNILINLLFQAEISQGTLFHARVVSHVTPVSDILEFKLQGVLQNKAAERRL